MIENNNVRKYPVSSKLVSRALAAILEQRVTPKLPDLFNAFKHCPYDSLKAVWVGQDPYPQDGVATGIAFANAPDTKYLSRSLQILKDSVYSYLNKSEKEAIFDPSLMYWEEQGILMLNSSLSTVVGEIGKHTMIWRPVIADFLSKLSWIKSDLAYILSGSTANSFKPYISGSIGIISTVHPSFCARTNTPFPDVFNELNNTLRTHGKEEVKWLREKQENS